MRFHVSTEPIGSIVPGRAYNHGQHICHRNHEECADSPRGKCIDDVTPICRVCRCELIGSEIGTGCCGDCRTATLRGSGR